MKADLHIHSELSDGKDSAVKIVHTLRRKASSRDKLYISFTDHNYLAHKPGVWNYQNITVIPGIEVSVRTEQYSLHLTAYSLEPKISPDIELWLRQIRDGYQKRARKIYKKVIGLGFNIGPFSKIRKADLPPPVYTYDLACKLKKPLRFLSEEQVLLWSKENEDLLKVREKNFFPDSRSAISMLHKAGFKVFWAHPGTRFLKEKSGEKIFKTLISRLKKEGIDGIEVFSPAHTQAQTRFFENYSRKLNLAISGGSDSHGPGRREESPVFILPKKYILKFIDLLESNPNGEGESLPTGG
ncbi:MAG: hypothetical protein Q8P91_00775 [bacterium]|nr:hypothetical protein [bacterium]